MYRFLLSIVLFDDNRLSGFNYSVIDNDFIGVRQYIFYYCKRRFWQ